MAMQLTGVIAPDARYRMQLDAGGHRLVADEPAANGGADAGPSPFLMVLAGLAACTGITLRMYAERHGWTDVGLQISLALHLREPQHSITRRVEVLGTADEAALQKLREVVERTPVTLALKSGFEISTTLGPKAG